ncbi:MAG: hypothetical protein JWO36_7531 [Myxococcales bacterium]|nr:hypothetical protein [Myxococcales bacterium]
MRLQLALVALLAASTLAHADGTVSMRGVYYKERSTRVMQPMLDGMFEVGERGLVTAHLLVDAITSASAGSGAANATPFTEKRYEGGIGYTRELDAPASLSFVDRFRLGGETKYSTESDYRSLYLGARGEADLAQKNAVLGLGGGVSIDRVDNSGAQGPMGGPLLTCDNSSLATRTDCPLRTYSGFASLSQIVGKNALVAVTYDIVKSHGFQANPYRQVLTGDGFVAEKHPNDRLRHAIALSGRYFVNTTQTTLIAAYRYYRDDWHIHAHTPELRIIQQVGTVADASVRYRYYTQTAAFFWEKRYASSNPAMNATPYFTDDPKMSAFTGHTLEAKLGVFGEAFDLSGKWRGARFEGVLEYILQHNRFGNAVVAHVSITVPFDY